MNNAPAPGHQTETGLGRPNARSSDKSRPGLLVDRAFWGMICTQFLGAFNDNLYKQLMLLLAVPAVLIAASEAGEGQAMTSDIQGWATFVFSAPFVIFSGFAGYLSDRFSKTPIIVLCKVAEVVIMALGLAAFYFYDAFGLAGTWVVLFLMGTQSTFFGPGKYGILPELFTVRDLPRANGLILMSTFLAIIFGIAFAGWLKTFLAGDTGTTQDLWPGLVICLLIAVVGTGTALMVRRVPAAEPNARFSPDCLALGTAIFETLKRDRLLTNALLVSSVFWLVSGLAVPTVNRLGKQFAVDDFRISILTASIGFGIILGAMFASWLCRQGWGDRSVSIGLWGMFAALVALGIWLTGGQHLLGYNGSIVALISMGVFAAIFAIPIQVFLQSRPPAELKGRMIATMNQANFVGIMISGPLYQLFEFISNRMQWPICSVFLMMSLLVLPLAVFYRLQSTDSEQSASRLA
ncbi:MAG: MFS transporter [Planctomycetales bacterium]|nr:MFS transporter [Planctomycetales bacterium]